MPPKSSAKRSNDGAEGGTVGNGANEARPAKAQRTRLACLRCQKRKIKCDSDIPRCGACARANVDCIDGKKITYEGSISRSDAASLYQYVQNLEAKLRDHIPSIDVESLKPSQYNLPNLSAGSSDGQLQTGLADAQASDIEENLTDSESPAGDEPQPQRRRSREERQPRRHFAHDIGLVPMSTGINKYIGPSSGFPLTSILYRQARGGQRHGEGTYGTTSKSPLTNTSLEPLSPDFSKLPSSVAQAVHLSNVYFEFVHVTFPFLHEQTFFEFMHTVYDTTDTAPIFMKFQVTMVLAISATILSKRLPTHISAEGLYSSAMRSLDLIDTQGTIEGLQCLLLVYVFTLHSPHSDVNPWYLNYQFLATVLDFGLQRDMNQGENVGDFQREMRTRIFWVIYTIDRTLATALGRPIGLRDEGCDLRHIQGLDDSNLFSPDSVRSQDYEIPSMTPQGSMICARILFRFAQLNSEIKYILHSINKTTPPHTYPQIPDIAAWQADMWQRLLDCSADTPHYTDERQYLTNICQIRYYEITMHLFRPTPHVRRPTKASLATCYQCAESAIRLWKDLYENDRLAYSWIGIHSICLSALTMLYCIWTSSDIASSTPIHELTSTMRDVSTLLTAAGEYWTEARKSRARLDGLTNATVKWLAHRLTTPHKQPASGKKASSISSGAAQTRRRPQVENSAQEHQEMSSDTSDNRMNFPPITDDDQSIPLNVFTSYITNEDLASFIGAPDTYALNNDFLMDGMFTDYQPFFDFTGNEPGSLW